MRCSRGIKLPPKHNDTPRFYSIKLLAKIKLITKTNNWTYISVITTSLTKTIFRKIVLAVQFIFYFDSSPIRSHGEGRVYDLYCSQPPGGDQRARSLTFQDVWGTPDLYISMGTTMSMMLLFTRSSSIRLGQPRHHFQKSQFWSVYTETQPRSFQSKTGSAAFSKVSVFEGGKRQSSVNNRCNSSKSYAF